MLWTDKPLWVQKTVAPCQWNKANVNKPDTLETFRKMSCYSFPYIICHMIPQLNLLLQKKKKKVHQAVGSMRFGQRQTTRQKGVRDGTVLPSFLLRRKWLPTASWPGVSAHPARSQDLECTQMRTKTQLQVIINGNRKLEKTVPSYANTTVLLSAFVCPADGLYSSFHNDPVCFFPSFSHITNRHAKCKSAHILIPFRQKHRDYHHTEFHNNLHNDNYSQPLSSVHTKDCNLNLALHRFSSIGAGYQANCLF